MTISEKLKIITRFAGLTQTELAMKLDVSFPTLNSWINERSLPHESKQGKIDDLYLQYTGQSVIPVDVLTAKKEIIFAKSKGYKNILDHIKSRPDLFDQFVLSLTYNTNSIEGSTLSENETAAVIFQNKSLPDKNVIEHLEAKNHQAALQYLFSAVNKKFQIDEDFVLRLHEILMNGIRDDAGLYRNHGVRIVGANVPTANYLKVPALMLDLIDEINSGNEDSLSQAVIIHSKFEKIHPFSDGNGRVGRLLMIAMLLVANLPPAVILQEKKFLYYTFLQKSQKEGDYSLLTDFVCDAILKGFDYIE